MPKISNDVSVVKVEACDGDGMVLVTAQSIFPPTETVEYYQPAGDRVAVGDRLALHLTPAILEPST